MTPAGHGLSQDGNILKPSALYSSSIVVVGCRCLLVVVFFQTRDAVRLWVELDGWVRLEWRSEILEDEARKQKRARERVRGISGEALVKQDVEPCCDTATIRGLSAEGAG